MRVVEPVMPPEMRASSEEVLHVLRACEASQVQVWLDGGWGVDALLGHERRPHSDIDLVVGLDSVEQLLLALRPLGYALVEDHLPTRAVVRSLDGRQVDLHPVSFDERGDGWQANALPDGGDCRYPADAFVAGTVAGRDVPCISPELQLAHHTGYEPRPHDYDDMVRLADAFDLDLVPPYGI